LGCEVSGRIKELAVDFNDRVSAGQVIARIEPELFDAEYKQAGANVAAAKATVQGAKVKLEMADWDLQRVQGLNDQGAGAKRELAAFQFAYDAAKAELALSEAQLQVAESVETLAKAKLDRATIHSPIDGVVLTRVVDVGQTVVAALQTPILYTLAHDLSRMTVHAHVSEADIGGVQVDQPVTFTVDAYPQREFTGNVRQVRHAATMIETVVTYDVVIDAPNDELLLKPGMTATVLIEVLRRDATLQIDNVALLFRPPIAPDTIETLTRDLVWPDEPNANDTNAVAADLAPPQKNLLWRFADETWHPVAVWFGIASEKHTEVLTGLEAGDAVVTHAVRPEGGSGLFDALRLADPKNRRL
jgi:HlyD family secretion protein